MELMRRILVALLAVVLLSYKNAGVEGQGLGLTSSVWLDDMAGALGNEAPMCDGRLGDCDEGEFMMESDVHGRLLRRFRYYISYGALAANRVPCPPRSGRSYYTRNCYSARGPVHPYRRGCTAITRCSRYTS